MMRDVLKPEVEEALTEFLSLDTKFDATGLILATFVAFTTLIAVPPTDLLQITLKVLEILGVVFAGIAVTMLVNNTKRKNNLEEERIRLSLIAKEENVKLERYLQRKLNEITKCIKDWAKVNNIRFRQVRSGQFKEIIDFKDFVVDYIEVEIADYQFVFTVRMIDTLSINNLKRFLKISPIKLDLIFDRHHIAPKRKIKITEENIQAIKRTLIDSILNPSYTLTKL